MLKSIAFRSAFMLVLTSFSTLPGLVLQAQTINRPAHTYAVTGGDPQPTGEPPKGKGQAVIQPVTIAILMALALA